MTTVAKGDVRVITASADGPLSLGTVDRVITTHCKYVDRVYIVTHSSFDERLLKMPHAKVHGIVMCDPVQSDVGYIVVHNRLRVLTLEAEYELQDRFRPKLLGKQHIDEHKIKHAGHADLLDDDWICFYERRTGSMRSKLYTAEARESYREEVARRILRFVDAP